MFRSFFAQVKNLFGVNFADLQEAIAALYFWLVPEGLLVMISKRLTGSMFGLDSNVPLNKDLLQTCFEEISSILF